MSPRCRSTSDRRRRSPRRRGRGRRARCTSSCTRGSRPTRRTSRCGGRGRSIRGRRRRRRRLPPWSGDRGRRARRRSSAPCSTIRTGRNTRACWLLDGDGGPGRPLRQGAPRPVRRVRAVARRLSWIDAIRPDARSTGCRGSASTPSPPGLPPFGTPICFENASPRSSRAFVRDGAGFLVVPVNNASYGTTAASAQHLQMSQMRAVENGRWVVHAAVSGISAFIDPSGRACGGRAVPARYPAATSAPPTHDARTSGSGTGCRGSRS